MTFGRYLIDRGICTQAQVDQAERSRVVFGGRVGTNLVEMGHLGVEDLEPLLAEYRALPVPPQAWLANRDPRVRDALPRQLIAKYQVLPLSIDGMTLHLAMLNPRDRAQIEELQFVSGCDIVPYALSEIRMRVLLAYHYDIPCDPRFLNLSPPISVPESEIPAPAAAEELLDEETFHALHADWQATPHIQRSDLVTEPDAELAKETAQTPASHALELELALNTATHRDAIVDAALELAGLYAEAAALFVVRGGIITGFRGHGHGLAHYIEGILLPVEVESAFAGVVRNATSYRGAIALKLDQRVVTALGRAEVSEALIVPIRIQRHVVNLLYADAGVRPLAETSVAALGAVATLASRAYQQLILRAKSQQGSEAD